MTISSTAAQDVLVNAYNATAVNNAGYQYSALTNSCVDHVRGGLAVAGISLPVFGEITSEYSYQYTPAALTNFPNNLFGFLSQLGTVVVY